MLPHYPLYIGLQSHSPQSQFSLSSPPHTHTHFPIRYTCAASSCSFSFIIVTDSRIESLGGGKVLAHATSVSPWPRLVSRDSRGYKNLSTVEVGLQVCLCQRFDRQSPTLNNPSHSLTVFAQACYVVLAQCNNPFITFGLSLFAPSLPLSQNRY